MVLLFICGYIPQLTLRTQQILYATICTANIIRNYLHVKNQLNQHQRTDSNNSSATINGRYCMPVDPRLICESQYKNNAFYYTKGARHIFCAKKHGF